MEKADFKYEHIETIHTARYKFSSPFVFPKDMQEKYGQEPYTITTEILIDFQEKSFDFYSGEERCVFDGKGEGSFIVHYKKGDKLDKAFTSLQKNAESFAKEEIKKHKKVLKTLPKSG